MNLAAKWIWELAIIHYLLRVLQKQLICTLPFAFIFVAMLPDNQIFTGQQAMAMEVRSSLKFFGICDGSAAIRIDKETVQLAYDEANSLYSFDLWGGKILADRSFENILGMVGSNEVDVEGAARHADIIWWIGSHGRDGDGTEAPARKVLFATNVPSRDLRDLEVLAGPLDLTDVLLSSPVIAAILSNTVLARKPKKGGLNIEGLAAPSAGGLLVGLRSPLSGADGTAGNAHIVHLNRIGATFTVHAIHRLDLDNRGIRDIVRDGKN